MKHLLLFISGLLLCILPWNAGLFAESPKTGKANPAEPLFDWSLLYSGSWAESKTLNNRADLKLFLLPPGLVARGQVIDRRPMDFELDPPWGEDQSKQISNYGGGLYHKPTGSRLLYGILDEWGLPARVRNPWISSAPFAENYKPIMADLKTSVSVTKEPETYLYLSTPAINLFQRIKLRGFASAQTETEKFKPDFSGGIDARFTKDTGLMLETFYSGRTFEATKSDSWFSDPPPLPQREYNLYAMGLLFNNPFVSVSSDWAYSEAFAWGRDYYGSMGLRINPPLPAAVVNALSVANTRSRSPVRPLSISFAADGATERFIGRDYVSHGEGFRCAGKIEWKGARSSLLRLNTTLRGPGIWKDFNRSSTGFYLRFPAPGSTAKNTFPFRMTRISLSMDRNAVDSQKISDGYKGTFGFNYTLPKISGIKNNSLGINVSASVKGISISDETPTPYPNPDDPWSFDNASADLELSWSAYPFQLATKWRYTSYAKKDELWDASVSASFRFKYGRLSLKATSPDFPDKWNYTVSWRLEKK